MLSLNLKKKLEKLTAPEQMAVDAKEATAAAQLASQL
jgi:hypothetical protein